MLANGRGGGRRPGGWIPKATAPESAKVETQEGIQVDNENINILMKEVERMKVADLAKDQPRDDWPPLPGRSASSNDRRVSLYGDVRHSVT